jgi:hypothetical protein
LWKFVEIGCSGAERDRSLDECNGGSVLAALMRDHAEQMQGMGLDGILGEDLPIAVLGFGESTGSVETEPFIE